MRTGPRLTRGRTLRAAIAAALLALLPIEAPRAAEYPVLESGPLPLRDRFLFSVGALALEPEHPGMAPDGGWRIGVVASLGNTWAQSDITRVTIENRPRRAPVTLEELQAFEPLNPTKGMFHADGEVHSLTFYVKRRVAARWEVAATLPLVGTGGGFADVAAEKLHNTIGLGKMVRQGATRDQFTIYLRLPSGEELFDASGLEGGIGDLTVSLKHRLPDLWGGVRHAVGVVLEFPTGSEQDFLASGSTDLGLRYVADKTLGRNVFRSSLGVVRVGSTRRPRLDSEVLLSGDVGWELAFGPRLSGTYRLSISESRFAEVDVARLEDNIILMDFGLKWLSAAGRTFFFGFTENVNQGSSPDFGVHVGVLQDF